MIQEIYSNRSSKRYISAKEIKKLKENMAKAPIIHDKAEQYHHQESHEADTLLAKIIDKNP